MDEQLLTILKLCLLALLYLFFFRVLRAVWAEIRGPKVAVASARQAAAPAPTAKAVRKAERKALPVQLAIVEPAALKGRTYPLAEELTVGRAAGCQVTIDDTYASQIHARVFSRDGQLFVEEPRDPSRIQRQGGIDEVLPGTSCEVQPSGGRSR